jgi:hypothetical protein
MASVTKKFLHHVLPGVVHPLRVLWNEAIAFLFLAVTLATLRPIYKAWQEWDMTNETGAMIRFGMAVIFAMFMLGFGISSYLRARRLSRTKRQ